MSDGLADSTSDHRHGRYILGGISGDGGADSIDGEELANACRRLGIAGPLEPLMREMKKDNSSGHHQHHHHHHHHHHQQQQQQQHHISRGGSGVSGGSGGGGGNSSNIGVGSNTKDQPGSGHHHRKYAHKSERKSSSATRHKEQHFDEGDVKNKSSTYGQESWGRDSGARDLSPEPSSHRMPASCGADSQHTDNEGGGNTASMIHLANKLQVAALSALKTEVLELSARLQNAERERDAMQRKMSEAIEEKERAQRRLESIGSAHESRLTEMHCVIVELNKKLKLRQDNAIMEENEAEGSVSDLSFQDGSVYNSEMECTNLEQESQTEPLDIKLVQPIPRSCDSPGSLPPAPTSASTQIQIQAMHEEILHLRGQVALLQSQLASDRDKQEDEQHDASPRDRDPVQLSPRNHSAYTSDDLCETAEIFEVPSQTLATTGAGGNEDIDYIRNTTAKYTKTNKVQLPSSSRGISPVVQLYGSISSLNKPPPSTSSPHQPSRQHSNELPVAKMAERVRLRRTIEEHHIPGTDLMNTSAICTTEIAEHLVSDFLQSDMEIVGGSEAVQNELHRLHRRIEQVRIQNSVLSFTLAESKANCNHLYLLCGKYESNAVALHQALNCSDRAIEAYDVMLALLESRLGILEGGGDVGSDETALTASAHESRKAAEAVAKHLMDRLDSEKNLHGTSLGPWHEAIVISAQSADNATPWTDADDQRLRGHVSKLKGQRACIQNTVVTLESPFCDIEDDKPRGPGESNTRMDLETAVLMQEVMSMREELSETKYRAEQAERDRASARHRLGVLQDAMVHVQNQLADAEALVALNAMTKDRSSYSEAEHSAGIERELVEALARESRLKARLQGLASSLEAATKSSEEKYVQVQSTVAELKQTNLTLNQSLDRCKRRYQSRLRRLEQQMAELTLKNGGGPLSAPIAKSPQPIVPETTL